MRKILYALTIAGLLSVGLIAQQGGGAFLPGFDYTISGVWTFSGVPKVNLTGLLLGNGSSTAVSAVTTSAGISGAISDETGSGLAVFGTAPVVNAPTGTESTLLVEATKAVGAAESGKVFFLNHATEFVSTLPAPAAGLTYTFIVTGAPAGANYTIVTTSSANVMAGACLSAAGDASSWLGDADTVTFVASQAVPGDFVSFHSDGTSWFVTGVTKVAAGCTVTKAT